MIKLSLSVKPRRNLLGSLRKPFTNGLVAIPIYPIGICLFSDRGDLMSTLAM